MKKTLTNSGLLLLFVAVVMGLAYVLPLWAAQGMVIILQVLCILVASLSLERRTGHGSD